MSVVGNETTIAKSASVAVMDISTVLTSTESAGSVPGDKIELLFTNYPKDLLNFAVFCCVLFILLGIPGNLVTIIALIRCKKIHNATAVFIINLSVSDLMFCSFNLPLAASLFLNRQWLHGDALCVLFPLLRYGLVAVSIFNVLAITINRYIMIGHPRLYPKMYKKKYLALMVALIWGGAFGALMPTLLGKWGKFGMNRVIGSCTILDDPSGHSPKEFLFVVAFLMPCIAIIVCYARIFFIVRQAEERSKCKGPGPGRLSEPREQRELVSNGEERNGLACKKNTILTVTESGSGVKVEVTEKSSGCVMAVDNSPSNVAFVNESSCSPAHSVTTIPDSQETLKIGSRDELLTEAQSVQKPPSRSETINDSSEPVSATSPATKSPTPFNLPGPMSPKFLPRRHRLTSTTTVNSTMSHIANVFKKNPLQTGKMTSKDKKLLKMILVIFVSFVICYLPITLVKVFKDDNIIVLNIVGYILIYLTTCINPIIYVLMSSEYRQAYKNLLTCRREKDMSSGPHGTSVGRSLSGHKA